MKSLIQPREHGERESRLSGRDRGSAVRKHALITALSLTVLPGAVGVWILFWRHEHGSHSSGTEALGILTGVTLTATAAACTGLMLALMGKLRSEGMGWLSAASFFINGVAAMLGVFLLLK